MENKTVLLFCFAITFYTAYVAPENTLFPDRLPTVADVADHIAHIVSITGIDYAGIGSDFDGVAGISGCRDVSEIGAITGEPVRRGYGEEDIAKIRGGNPMRVFSDVTCSAEE